jgi:ketosteroid isomerase-like protein
MRATLATIGFLLLSTISVPVSAQSADERAVEETVRAFHAALAAGDSAAVVRLLAPDALILEAGGLETRAQYREHHLPGDLAYAKAVPSERARPTIVVSGDVAWVVGTSRTTGTYRERPVNSTGAELMVLSRGPSGWVIRAVHWSSRAVRSPS